MHSKLLRPMRGALSTFITLLALVNLAVAGPPLICHSFDIGNAKSLPWIGHDWKLSGGENYDARNLANDTLDILAGSKFALVHMETLRRATLYARKDPVAAKQLLLKIVARAKSNENSSTPDAFALFDAAYLTEAYKQWMGEKGENPADGLDGYPWMKRAIQLRANDPQMQFAAALITLRGAQDAHQDYTQKALAGGKSDELLARNLAAHFLGAESQTMTELILRSNATKVAKR